MLIKHEALEILSSPEESTITFYGHTGEEQTHLLLYEMNS
jgi:hypothetical protein